MGATGVMSCSNPSSLSGLVKRKGIEKAVKPYICTIWGRDLRAGHIGLYPGAPVSKLSPPGSSN